jgi:hypothetical protein
VAEERVQRRLAAILVVDVVGYSRLVEQDETGAFERLQAHRKELFEPAIERHHGRVFKLMGDALLAEFSSVVDAVECAAARHACGEADFRTQVHYASAPARGRINSPRNDKPEIMSLLRLDRDHWNKQPIGSVFRSHAMDSHSGLSPPQHGKCHDDS